MSPERAVALLCIILIAITSAGCGGSLGPGQEALSGTGTAQAIDTLAASTRQALAKDGAVPTGTPAHPVGYGERTQRPSTPTASKTPASVWIEVRIDTNCRLGPGKDFEMVGALLVGERTRVVQRSIVPDYWVVDNPDNPGRTCYLWGRYATLEGDLGSLALDTPPTATPVPASISGWSFFDLNGNGVRDPQESGEVVSYARFSLKTGACPGEVILRRVESNAYGRIFIPDLLSGTYCLIPDPGQPGLLPQQVQIELGPNQQLDDINFRAGP
jgi:hypothetical protein